MELLKKLLENLGINEETFKNTFAIIIEAGERLKRIEEKLDRVEQQQNSFITFLMDMSHDNPPDYFEKQDESGELVSAKFDDAIAIDGLQRNAIHDNVVSSQPAENDDGANTNIGKS